MGKPKEYILFELHCTQKKCSEQQSKNVDKKLNRDITENFSEKDLKIKSVNEKPSFSEKECKCYCVRHVTYQKRPTTEALFSIYETLSSKFNPKIVLLKKIKKQKWKNKKDFLI
jgi:hypothetical protein